MPARLLQRAVANERTPRLLRRVAAAGLGDRWTTITSGPAAGLAFNCGPSNAAYTTGTNEVGIQRVFEQHIAPGDCVLDVGANVGFFTVLAARRTGSAGQVVAFEPDERNAACIVANAARNGFSHVEVVQAAVADQAGRAVLWQAAYAGGHALESAGRPPDAIGQVEVDVVTIDGMRRDGRVPRVAFVKIDVEGAELDVVRGMTETLHNDRPVMLIEVDAEQRDELERRVEAVRDLLAQHEVGLELDLSRLEDAYPGIDWCVAHLLATPR